MQIKVNKNTYKIRICHTFKDKLLGNMFKRNIDEIIYLKNTSSIHTFFMKDNIDIIFLNNKKIIKKCYNVKPNKIIICKCNGVIELPKNTINEKDKIEIFN